MAERILLHIGVHKTGSTSLQQLLQDQNDGVLADVGALYPPGFLIPSLHADLPLLTIAPERTWPARLRFPETLDPGWQAAAATHVRQQITDPQRPTVIWSHEDLSYLRGEDELERLRHLLRGPEVHVVVFVREPVGLLRSYRAQLLATGFELSDDPSSFAYVEPDSWIVDHGALLDGYRHAFGTEAVTVIDYDEVLERDRSAIPAFTDLLGIPRAALPELDGYFFNQHGSQLRVSEEHLDAIRRRAVEQSRG